MFRDRALGVVIGLNVANKAAFWLNLMNLENFLKLMLAQLLSFSMYGTYVQSVVPNRKKKSGGGQRADNHFLLILICGTLNHFWTRPERNQLSAVVLWLWAARSLFSLYCTVCGTALLGKEHELLQLFSLARFTLLFHFLAFLWLERERNSMYNKRIESQFCRLPSQESRLKNRD